MQYLDVQSRQFCNVLQFADMDVLTYYFKTVRNDNMPTYVCITDGHIIEYVKTEKPLTEITKRAEIKKIEQMKLVNLPGAYLKEIK